jgi:hypothetical protein
MFSADSMFDTYPFLKVIPLSSLAILQPCRVADLDPGFGAFLTPGSGIWDG